MLSLHFTFTNFQGIVHCSLLLLGIICFLPSLSVIDVYCFFLRLGVIAARDATLTFMVGGQEESFAVAEKILQNIGKNVVHCGGVGTGQV